MHMTFENSLYMYTDRKEMQRPAFNYLESNQINYLDNGNGSFDLLIR